MRSGGSVDDLEMEKGHRMIRSRSGLSAVVSGAVLGEMMLSRSDQLFTVWQDAERGGGDGQDLPTAKFR